MFKRLTQLIQNQLISQFILSLLWVLMFVLTNSFSNFPLNDDWVHAKSVKILVEQGEFRLIDYCGSTIIFQVFWGALFCVFGFSFMALRISVMTLGLIGLLAFYKIVFNISQDKRISFFSTLLMAVNPIYFALSGTFMLDVPFSALTLLSLYCYIQAIRTPKLAYFAFACLFSIMATYTRQIGLLLPFCFMFPFIVTRNFRSKPILFSILSFIMVVSSYMLFIMYLKSYNMLPSAFSGSNVVINNLLNRSIFNPLMSIIGYSFFYIGLFLLPFSILMLAKNSSMRLKNLLILTIVIFIVAKVVDSSLLGNIVKNIYIGPIPIEDIYNLGVNLPQKLGSAGFYLLKLLGILGSVFIFVLFIQKLDYIRSLKTSASKTIFYALLFYFCVYLSFILLANSFFDRYLLPIFFVAILLLLPEIKINFTKKRWTLYGFITIALLSFSVCGFHDYLALNEARWKASKYLLEDLKMPPKSIDGGYEFNGWYYYSPDIVNYSDKTRWGAKNEKYIITNGNLPATKTIKEISYTKWLPYKTETIKILEKFDLKNYPQPPTIFFDIENTSPNKKFLISVDNKVVFEQSTRTTEFSHSGIYSFLLPKLSESHKLAIPAVNKGDYFASTFWCHTSSSNIVLRLYSDSSLYKTLIPTVLDKKNDWSLLAFDTYIDPYFPQFLYLTIANLSPSPIFIDDLSIIHEPF